MLRNDLPGVGVEKHFKKGKEVTHVISACTLGCFVMLLLYKQQSVSLPPQYLFVCHLD